MARKRRRTLHAVLVDALDVASYSASKLAADAGLDWSTLAKWKAGTRAPQPPNAADVGKALAARGRRMQQLGDELVQAAEAEAEDQGGEGNRGDPPG